MALRLNKIVLILLMFCFACGTAEAQQRSSTLDDYKDQEQFKKFLKRRRVIGAWQINQLKTGALVIRLKTNARLIETLKAQGNVELANKKYFENFAMNKNLMLAFKKYYNFSKVYFILSHSSDSLLKGAVSGIFLDTNMRVDPTIVLQEKFYLLGEKDYVFNSSIGFVPIDSAQKQIEHGNPGTEMFMVLKNKFGHQLKEPFPYAVNDPSLIDLSYHFIGTTNEKNEIIWFPAETDREAQNIKRTYPQYQNWVMFDIKKKNFVSKLSVPIMQLNTNLRDYYQVSPPPDMSRIDDETKKFLY